MMFRNATFYIYAALLVCCFCLTQAQAPQRRSFLGLFAATPRCNGCPSHFCDDDPAIIHGYCCGCAGYFDRLPVQCSPYIQCPINNYELCEQYNYILYCCCSK